MESLARQSASFSMQSSADGPASQQQVLQLQLRLAAEQQCVLREQHITARMWLEKSQAEERAEQARATNQNSRRARARAFALLSAAPQARAT